MKLLILLVVLVVLMVGLTIGSTLNQHTQLDGANDSQMTRLGH